MANRSGEHDGPEHPTKPRVAIVTHVYSPSIGGAEIYHRLTAEALSGDAVVRVFTSNLNLPPSAQEPRAVTGTGRAAVEVLYLPSRAFFGERWMRPLALWKALRRFAPTLIWTNQPSLSGIVAACFALLNSRPWVATYHADLMPERFYSSLDAWLEARLLRRASGVIVHGEPYAEALRRRGVPKNLLHVSPPGPGVWVDDPPGRPPGAFLPGPDHPFLFVGGLDDGHRYKRPELFLRALARLREQRVDVRAWVVGEGNRRRELESLARSLALDQAVAFRGRISQEELASLYRDAWALVLPSTAQEGFGMVALEAVHYGCPAIVSDAAAVGPLLESRGCARTFHRADPSDLESVLRLLWVDPTERRRLANATREASVDFSWPNALPRILRPIWDSLSAAPRREPT